MTPFLHPVSQARSTSTPTRLQVFNKWLGLTVRRMHAVCMVVHICRSVVGLQTQVTSALLHKALDWLVAWPA